MSKEKNKILIEEQDVFTYVFFPEKLSDDKRQVIQSDDTLKEALEFYKELKQNSEREPSHSLQKKIAAKNSSI